MTQDLDEIEKSNQTDVCDPCDAGVDDETDSVNSNYSTETSEQEAEVA